jgi:hypothetical protein
LTKDDPTNELQQTPSDVARYLPTDACEAARGLAAVAAAWHVLPEVIKAGILAMVKESYG